METHLQKSPTDSSDAKYVSGLSTILVATIQEAKDRISQIEYIFCSQLVPNFQLKYQNMQKSHSEARKVAELAYKEKENDLLLQITRIQSEKQQILEGNHLLKLEIEKITNMENQSCNHVKKLQEELKQKMVEVNEGREAQKNMQKLLESNASLIHSYEKTTKELEDRVTLLLKEQKTLEVENEDLRLNLMKKSSEVDEVMKLEKKVDELQSALREKTEAVDKAMEVQRNLLKKIEYQDSERMNNEQQLSKREKENMRLASNVENLVSHVDELQKLLANKNSELEEGRKVLEQLLKQIDSSSSGRMKRGNEFYEYENEKKLLLDKQKDLEEKVNKLQLSLYERSKESSEGMELHVKLLQQIEAKDLKLKSEKQKILTLMSSYKNLKSQYRYLCQKHGHTPETMLPYIKKEDESETEGDNQTPVTFHGKFHDL
ncbi:hypothetical protein ACJIZ3_007657 [Penstemon smallii]|uniref:Uncharacterized protein n=1 Tax=Penstemon smallii TaxID=265156 RepID=A0ABD3T8J9_9LAMI